jgi:phosphoribosyl-ATP pyrophosphohydrolase/phosphoribosyl-AMP cyclohydrolase
MRRLDPAAVRYGADGLAAAVVVDATHGDVLMVGWQDAEAVEATLATREVHFHSRSRGRLWRKGETSGHVLRLVDAWLDCDADAILLAAVRAGPTCHTGARSCFDAPEEPPTPQAPAPDTDGAAPATGPDERTAGPQQGFAWLETLWTTIEERARTRPVGSYTARLLDGGVDGPARKVGEEAIEVLMAAKDDAAAQAAGEHAESRGLLAGEVADLAYHLLVLLAERDLAPAVVIDVLRSRHAG